MIKTVSPSPLSGTLRVMPSKSASHRAVMMAALAKGETELSPLQLSRDIEATLACAQALGLYAYLFPMSENPFVCSQCRRQLQRIREYDSQNRTSLEQTARVYVQEKMEIAATAKALFQHPNTVRYRLTKIQKLMDMEDDAMFAPMLSLMMNLSRILEEEGRS